MYPSHPLSQPTSRFGAALLTLALLFFVEPLLLSAQTNEQIREMFSASPNLLLPQQGATAVAVRSPDGRTTPASSETISIASVAVSVEIEGRTATTRLVTTVQPPASLAAGESTTFQLLLPLPVDAELLESPLAGTSEAVNRVQLNMSAGEATRALTVGAQTLANREMLEFANQRVVLVGPFTISSGEAIPVELLYRQTLVRRGNRLDYRLPRSESFAFAKTPWDITATIRSDEPIAALYSPSHPISVERDGPNRASLGVDAPSLLPGGLGGRGRGGEGPKVIDPGDFRLSILQGREVEASFMGYVDQQSSEGCLLMLVGASPGERVEQASIRREVILVIDRSGSMGGEKIEQARAAAREVLSGLRDGEAFTVVDYSDEVTTFSEEPVEKNAVTLRRALAYIDGIEADGGTNIHDALGRAVAMRPTAGHLPLVIFLTDGLPTTGVTAEDSIRRAVIEANVHGRRIFTVGVGFDVNAPLLDAIARESRASTTIVMPGESVDQAVALLFRKLNGPIFSDITLAMERRDGSGADDLVSDLLPTTLNDLYEGDYLSLLGHFRPDEPVVFILRGDYLGEEREFRFTFDPSRDRIEDAPFLCRLWATRQIMERVDQITRDGAIPESERTDEDRDRLQQRTQEIIDLSMTWGIITEYTRHLTEGSREHAEYASLVDDIASGAVTADSMLVAANGSLDKAGAVMYAETKMKDRAQNTRTGRGASNQVMNKGSAKLTKAQVSASNAYIDEEMNVVEIHSVQQIADLALFRRGDRWVDSRILDSAATEAPDLVVTIGSAEYDDLVRELVTLNREKVLGLSGEILVRNRAGQIVLIAAIEP